MQAPYGRMFKLSLRLVLPLAVLAVSFASDTTSVESPRESLVAAIQSRRIVTFMYQGRSRTVEPHACGISPAAGEAVLHGYQVDGDSSSGHLPGWRTFMIAKITALTATETRFDGPRADYSAGRPRLDPLWAEARPAEVR